jgi:hypothetical protein
MLFAWCYHDFVYRHGEIQDELCRKHPKMERVQLISSLALVDCEQTFYWESVYLTLLLFLKEKSCLPEKYDMQQLRTFYLEKSKKIDPATPEELRSSGEARSLEIPE